MVSGRLATISAPLVENGETSTIVEETASAATTATALTSPVAISGMDDRQQPDPGLDRRQRRAGGRPAAPGAGARSAAGRQPRDREPLNSLRGHRTIAAAIHAGDADTAAAAMPAHIEMVSDVAVLRG